MNDPLKFNLTTCEHRVENRLKTWEPRRGKEFASFMIDDVDGLRRAVVPVFEVDDDGKFTGLGTAFSADPWNTFLTADHIFYRKPTRTTVVILSFGWGFGTVRIPDSAIARIAVKNGVRFEIDDPLARLRGEPRHSPIDLSMIKLHPGHDASLIANLPIRARPAPLKVGDWVIALGYPGIEVVSDTPASSMSRIQNCYLRGAVGKVTHFHQAGRGSFTPVFEVEGHWPSGMSGGPILNQTGEVVGVVSKGLDPGDNQPGTSWGVWLERVGINGMAPTIDDWGPQLRRCWATMKDDRASSIFPDEGSAREHAAHSKEALEKVRLLVGTKQWLRGWDE